MYSTALMVPTCLSGGVDRVGSFFVSWAMSAVYLMASPRHVNLYAGHWGSRLAHRHGSCKGIGVAIKSDDFSNVFGSVKVRESSNRSARWRSGHSSTPNDGQVVRPSLAGSTVVVSIHILELVRLQQGFVESLLLAVIIKVCIASSTFRVAQVLHHRMPERLYSRCALYCVIYEGKMTNGKEKTQTSSI